MAPLAPVMATIILNAQIPVAIWRGELCWASPLCRRAFGRVSARRILTLPPERAYATSATRSAPAVTEWRGGRADGGPPATAAATVTTRPADGAAAGATNRSRAKVLRQESAGQEDAPLNSSSVVSHASAIADPTSGWISLETW